MSENGTPSRIWMQTQLTMAVRALEDKFPGANVTLIVSAPGCGAPVSAPLRQNPEYSHATSAEQSDLRAILRHILNN